ncbi:T9SS type A sorting domain-containing protein [Salibacter halophilus]|uniref:T9SS type A sorting domain-containing protein n=1 Tax=Salibacter halophilus TaxID=1803916 RepID=A0A6N6M1J3_9FLAO|nr:T9SS type A sorting domain-containing protein [Salibacter halophilus]KAB1062082.1 T9SS type A sorting domain-containing protein [Salibacter halophilus]
MRKTLHLFNVVVFSLICVVGYSQTYTFTNAGATGENGPTQAQINTAYTGTNLDGAVTSNGGIQYWEVPSSGLYEITALGGQGYGTYGGRGASITGEFLLNGGDTLKILVGQAAPIYPSPSYDHQYGGGGGSFITTTNNTPLIVAGGGGGNHALSFIASCDGQITQNGAAGVGGSTIGAGGTNGNGGQQASSADGGAGIYGNGNGSAAGVAFVNGGQGGSDEGIGGFGGGGGTSSWNNYRCGGGGGYSGGGAANNGGTCCPTGGGGGSFNGGQNPVNLAGVQTGHGLVVINRLSGGAPNDAGVSSIEGDGETVTCAGMYELEATINNFGTLQLNSFQVNWSVNGALQTPLVFNNVLDTLNGQGSSDTLLTLGQFDIQSAGTYNIIVWTSMPNGVSDTSNFNDTSRAEIYADLLDLSVVDFQDVRCAGESNGVVKVTSNAYNPVYYWSSGAIGDSVSTLWAETHQVVVSDTTNRCPDTLDVTVLEPTPVSVSLLSGGSVPCFGDNLGMVSVEGLGGVGGYTYYWGNGSTDSTRNNLNVNTTHNVTVTDGNGCQATESFTIFEPEELQIETTNINSNAGCENQIGLVAIDAVGGTEPYSYSWSNGATGSAISGLSGGNYTVTVTDKNGCQQVESYRIYDIDVSVTNLSPTLVANLSGATYQWINCDTGTPVDGATSSTFTPEDNGSYAVVISSGNCSDTSRCIDVLNTSTDVLNGDLQRLNVFPNPSSGEFSLIFGSTVKNATIELVDVKGVTLMTREVDYLEKGQKLLFNIDSSKGVYFMNVKTDNHKQVLRILIN